jgi:RNA polymerase sigma-70 factor (ECF subfamily)
MDPAAEIALVRRCQGGDRTAFEEIVRAYARLIWASVYGLVRDPAWTEDLVQDTFLRAWESIAELKEPGAFRGWLLTIARRLAWRRAELSGRDDPAPGAPDRTAPLGAADPEETRERVQEALARLPERYRIPVTLHFLNGMEYGAISKLTGLANGSLRGLIARGAAKLRSELAPWWRKKDEHA